MAFAFANVGVNNDTITLDQVFFGTLLLKLEEGSEEHIPAPLLSSRYDIDITGVIARTTLTQHFRNSSDLWLEGARDGCRHGGGSQPDAATQPVA